jgi:hypothetical protein
MTYTKGPWVHAVKRSKIVGLPVVQAGTGRSVCNVTGFHVDDPAAFMSECLDNARLIAAAPELVEALRGMLAEFVGPYEEGYTSVGNARALLARIDGEQA